MEAFLPFLFIALSALALFAAISFLWGSLRVLFGGDHELYLEQSSGLRRRMELLDEKAAVLKSLRDLEFEREVGKLSEEDFARLAADFRARAKRILRTLDEDLREHREKASKLVASELKQARPGAAREPNKESAP
jgi:hypothetical protein